MMPPSRVRTSPPADQTEVFLGGQQGGDVEVVGDHAQVLVVHQRMGHRFRRGADIDEQRGAVRDLAGDALRDAGFLFRPHHLAIVISSVDRAGRQRRAAVVTLDLVLVGGSFKSRRIVCGLTSKCSTSSSVLT